ncbi:MAG TPA: transglycosylase SLT domain-containing protein [Pyrinomonadaceae bacterium]|nr:transglycosylase SLT domain-containing protein [Pyrinomonadaceae bacterium]
MKSSRLSKLIPGFLLLVSATGIIAQTAQERHQQIQTAVQAGNLPEAIAELESLRQTSPALFAANNYDYLLARLHEKNGNMGGSTASYQQVVDRNSLLAGYALWRLAQIARSAGDLVHEREYLRQLIATTTALLIRDAATMRLAESLFESGDYPNAVSVLAPLTNSSNRTTARAAQALTGDAFLKANQRQEARPLFTKLVMQMPDASRPDDYALAAVRNLDRLDTTEASVTLAEAEHLLRASVYQFNRDFEAARRHYAAVAESYPQSGSVANALYQIGRGFYLQRQYDEALDYFQRVLNRFPDSMSARDALTFSAGSYNRLKRTDDAIAAYRRLIEQFPDAPNPERPYLNIIDALHEAARHKEALDWVRQTRERFKGQLGAAVALFAQTRIHLAQGEWTAVVADTDELLKLKDIGGTRVPGGATSSEVTFLRAYALDQLGRTDVAITGYLAVPDGRNEYYGGLATRRLQAMATEARFRGAIQARAGSLRSQSQKALAAGQQEQARVLAQDALRLTVEPSERKALSGILRQAYGALPAYKLPSFKIVPLGRQMIVEKQAIQSLADELLFLGLPDEGAPEFAAARGSGSSAAHAGSSADIDYTLAILFLRGGLANRTVRFGEQVWRNVPADYVVEVAPQELLDLLYPLPYRDSLLRHAPPKSVDPRLVISIARQESRFQADAKSVAAARGLMQFIPSTADEMAAQLGMNPFRQDNLYAPDTAILFGSQYLANLFAEFPGLPEAVVASYNGGPDNMARWVARSRSNDPARYVSEIGFTQTKDYVFKVMTNFWIYQRLYDAQLQKQTQ